MADKPLKLTGRALAHFRVYKAANDSTSSYGMGGLLKRGSEKPKITLRRAEYEKNRSGE